MAAKNNQRVFFVIFIILGVLLAVQFRSTLLAEMQRSASKLDIEHLIASISEEMQINEQLKSEIEENILKKQMLLKSIVDDKNDDILTREWQSVWLKAGLTAVKGPGITIKLDDADAREKSDNLELLIIHDQDIRFILNELKKAGAQAISINGERIVPMSEQICAGPTILINKNRYPVPYIINAIGDPDLLYDAFIRSERVAQMLRDKIRIEVAKSKEVLVPAFSNIDNIDRLISGLEVVK